MVTLDGDGKGGFDCLKFSDDVAVSVHDMFDGKGRTVVEAVKYTGIVHVVVVDGGGDGMPVVT